MLGCRVSGLSRVEGLGLGFRVSGLSRVEGLGLGLGFRV